MDRLPQIQSQNIVENRLDFPFEKKIETLDRLARIHEPKRCSNNG